MGAVLLVLFIIGTAVLEKFREWRDTTPAEGTVEYVEHLYATGEIDLDELEQRLAVLADPEADRIRRSVERISGIGEKTSFNVAAEFDTVDDLRDVDEDSLTDLPNVGVKRAKNIKKQL